MEKIREILRRLGYLLSHKRRARELEAEMAFHREMSERSGRPEAHRSFGNTLRLREQSREAWGWTWIDRLFQDLRYAVRMLMRSPGFTITAILILAIGIGVNISAFSIVNLVLLKPLPVRNAASLLRLQRRSPEAVTHEIPYPTTVFYRDHARSLSAVIVSMIVRLEFEDDTKPVRANFVSANYFQELGANAAYGRLLDPQLDGTLSAPPVVVLGHDFWQRRFAADPAIVGKTIHLNRKPVTVVGIEPYAFPSLDSEGGDIWLPITSQPYLVEGSKVFTDTTHGIVRMYARMAPGYTPRMVEQELLGLTNELRKQYPKDIWKDEYIRSDSASHQLILQPEMYSAIVMVGVLTLLILAVACANLGGLLLARGVVREHELGIRIAIGASRQRIFRQLFTESLLLTTLGSVTGLGLAYVTIRITLAAAGAPTWMSASPDWRVMVFVVGLALLTSLLFGLAPALQMVTQKRRKTRVRQVLLGAQVAASCVLLIVASLLVRAVQHALFTDPGFGYEQVLTVDPGLDQHGYKPAVAQVYLTQLKSRILAVPGVASVSLVKLAPMGHHISTIDDVTDGVHLRIYPNSIDREYFTTMSIPILLGRNFLPGESQAVIVSESLARQRWPGQNPIGKLFWDKDTVVGVVGNARVNALSEDDTVELYSLLELDDMPETTVVLKSHGAPDGLTPTVKAIVQNLDPKLFPEIRLLHVAFRQDMKSIEIAAGIVSLIGVLAMLLAALGILGLVAFTVSQRTKEIAIRLALGAPRTHVLSAVLRQFSWPLILGVAAGIAGTTALSQILRRVLYGVSNLDPISYVSAVAMLIIITACALLLPAWRALELDVAHALHQE
jgi:predicted permease